MVVVDLIRVVRRGLCGLAWLGGLAWAGPSSGPSDPSTNPTDIESWAWQAQVLTLRSTWREQDAQGGQLLVERGLLHGSALGLAGRSSDLLWAASVQALTGVRDNDGRTNQGMAMQTRSDIRDAHVSLRLGAVVASGWRAGFVVQPHWVQRSLRSTALAQGYRETWRWTLLEAGLQWQPDPRLGWSGEVAAGLGLSPRVRFTLPGMDPLTLQPGQGHSARMAAQYRGAWGGGDAPVWRWVVGLQAERLRFAASTAVPLTSNGQLRGGASQPKTTMQSVRYSLGIEADLR